MKNSAGGERTVFCFQIVEILDRVFYAEIFKARFAVYAVCAPAKNIAEVQYVVANGVIPIVQQIARHNAGTGENVAHRPHIGSMDRYRFPYEID